MLTKITSPDNPLIKSLLKLDQKKYREEQKEFIIEGFHLVNEAYQNHYLKMVLGTDENELKKFTGVETYLISKELLGKLSSTVNPQSVIGISKLLNNYDLNLLKNKEETHIVILDEVNDPGNLGTIIRTSAAIGYDLIAMSSNTVDLYNSKVVRATQGTLYHINVYIGDIIPLIKKLKEFGITIYGTSLKDAVSINSINKSKRLACVFGNEARGVSSEVLNAVDQKIFLPMENNVESLNVAVASGIIMYELKK